MIRARDRHKCASGSTKRPTAEASPANKDTWEAVSRRFQNSWVKKTLLVLLVVIVSNVAVRFVGDPTLYSLNSNKVREEFHESVIHNQAPEGGWAVRGANGINVRVAIPYLVEFVHRVTGIRVVRVYEGVDLVCLWLGIAIFCLFLNKDFTVWESALACLYFAALLPLTFAFHTYHPYDRASFVTWVLGIWCARAKRIREFTAVSVIAVLIKYDAIVLPALYFLGNSTRQNWRKHLVHSSAIGALLVAIVIALIVLIPGGFEHRDYVALMRRNLEMMIDDPIFYAPTLAFGLPIGLAIVGYRVSGRFVRASVWFAGGIIFILFFTSNFEEVRAEQMLFPLLAPGALLGLRRILGEPSSIERQPLCRTGCKIRR